MKELRRLKFILLFGCVTLLCNCSADSDNQDLELERASISIKLIDAPGDYDNIFVDIADVYLKVIDDETNPKCWLKLDAKNTGVYDLLELTNGVHVNLIENLKVPTGLIYEIRLVLGDRNNVVIDGIKTPLATPQMHQEGLKVRIEKQFEANKQYSYTLDFKADESILKTNVEDYIILKPVVTSTLEK